MDANTCDEDRKQKQSYLYQHVVEAGYDTESFAQFMNYKKSEYFLTIDLSLDDGTNIDKWTYDDLVAVVQEFRQY